MHFPDVCPATAPYPACLADCYQKCVKENAWCKEDKRSWCDKWGKGFKDYCHAKCTCGEPLECPKKY